MHVPPIFPQRTKKLAHSPPFSPTFPMLPIFLDSAPVMHRKRVILALGLPSIPPMYGASTVRSLIPSSALVPVTAYATGAPGSTAQWGGGVRTSRNSRFRMVLGHTNRSSGSSLQCSPEVVLLWPVLAGQACPASLSSPCPVRRAQRKSGHTFWGEPLVYLRRHLQRQFTSVQSGGGFLPIKNFNGKTFLLKKFYCLRQGTSKRGEGQPFLSCRGGKTA